MKGACSGSSGLEPRSATLLAQGSQPLRSQINRLSSGLKPGVPQSLLPVRVSLASSRACPSASSCSRRASSWASCLCTSNRLLSKASFSNLQCPQTLRPRDSASLAPGNYGSQGVASVGPGPAYLPGLALAPWGRLSLS